MAILDSYFREGPLLIEFPQTQAIEVLEVNGSLIPTSGPVAALDTRKPLNTVQFGIVNFPDFMKPRSIESQTDTETPWTIEDLRTIRLDGEPWLVEIRPVRNREQVYKSLRQHRGFAVTHWGTITRPDGKLFTKETVKPFLSTLNRFLSFARGVNCGITLVRGLDECGETVWEEWGITNAQNWAGHKSCFDLRNGATLEDFFVGFWRYLHAHARESQTYPALEWYLESNAQEALHTSIVLNQAALERRPRALPAAGGPRAQRRCRANRSP